MSTPNKFKESELIKYNNSLVIRTAMQGWRSDMEDESLIFIDNELGCLVFCVMDGHSGSEISRYVKLKIRNILRKDPNFMKKDFINALKYLPQKLDDSLLSEEGQMVISDLLSTNNRSGSTGGSTLTIGIIYGKQAYIANVGDSPCYLYTNNNKNIFKMFEEHNTRLGSEIERIEKVGGFIENNRVLGKINITRAIGDFEFKNKNNKQNIISTDPKIFTKELNNDDYIVMGSDGAFEKLSPKIIGNYFIKNELNIINCERLIDTAVSDTYEDKIGKDNVTLIVFKYVM